MLKDKACIQTCREIAEVESSSYTCYYSIPVPTATTNTNVTTDVPSVAKQGTSQNADSGPDKEEPQLNAEANVPTANSSADNVHASSGTNGNDVAPKSSIRNSMESLSEQEMLRRRRLEKFSAQLTTE